MNAEKFIQNKLDTIENAIEPIQRATDILVNGEDYTNEELTEAIQEACGARFEASAIVKEWNEYARITYLRLQITKNLDYSSVACLNATLFVHSFLEKFLK